jgi:hypothetical protein
MTPNFDDTIMIICPPYPQWKEQPKDQSLCTLRDCPKCDGKMWLSEKKKGFLMFSAFLTKNIILCCYKCAEKMALENGEWFRNLKKTDI